MRARMCLHVRARARITQRSGVPLVNGLPFITLQLGVKINPLNLSPNKCTNIISASEKCNAIHFSFFVSLLYMVVVFVVHAFNFNSWYILLFILS